MEYDVNKARAYAQKLAAVQAAAQKKPMTGSDRFWKPSMEKRTVRILPVRDPNMYTSPFYDSWTHYKFAGKNISCPEGNNGEPCAICDFVRQLRGQGKKEEANLIKASLGFQAILVERQPDGSVSSPKVWTFSSINRYNQFIDLLGDAEYSKFTNVDEEGWDFRIYHTAKAIQPSAGNNAAQNKMRNVELHVMPLKQRPLHEDPAVVARVLEEAAALDKYVTEVLHKPMTSSEVEAIFNTWMQSSGAGTSSKSPEADMDLTAQLNAALKMAA